MFLFVFNAREEPCAESRDRFGFVERHLVVDLAALKMAGLTSDLKDGPNLGSVLIWIGLSVCLIVVSAVHQPTASGGVVTRVILGDVFSAIPSFVSDNGINVQANRPVHNNRNILRSELKPVTGYGGDLFR